MIWDVLFLLGRPLAYLSEFLDLKRLIKTRSAKDRSITAWMIPIVLTIPFFMRSLLVLHDWIYTLNSGLALVLDILFIVLIIRWRKQ